MVSAKKRYFIITLASALVLVLGVMIVLSEDHASRGFTAVSLGYEIVNIFPHDQNAFTEGLVFQDGFLYESTGLYGNSSLRRVELQTGRILQTCSLPEQFFGEGVTILGSRIIQLTWQSHTGFVYDKETFSLLGQFSYPNEGWGITNDGSRLIMSDGTANLYFFDPNTFQKVGQLEITDNGPVTELNELEYVQGKVFANVWRQDRIAVINPETGKVEVWLNLSGLRGSEDKDPDNVLNGIAFDEKTGRLFVTGKRWPWLYEIRLVKSISAADQFSLFFFPSVSGVDSCFSFSAISLRRWSTR